MSSIPSVSPRFGAIHILGSQKTETLFHLLGKTPGSDPLPSLKDLEPDSFNRAIGFLAGATKKDATFLGAHIAQYTAQTQPVWMSYSDDRVAILTNSKTNDLENFQQRGGRPQDFADQINDNPTHVMHYGV